MRSHDEHPGSKICYEEDHHFSRFMISITVECACLQEEENFRARRGILAMRVRSPTTSLDLPRGTLIKGPG